MLLCGMALRAMSQAGKKAMMKITATMNNIRAVFMFAIVS